MSNEKPSHQFEHAVLEASALLITLLFIMLQLGETWKDPAAVAAFSLICFAFAFAAVLAVFNMGLELSRSPAFVLRLGETYLMVTGLSTLTYVFYAMAARVPGNAQVIQDTVAWAVGTMTVVAAILLIGSRRSRPKAQSSSAT